MKYYHHLIKEEADEARKLPNKVFQKTYSRPAQCGYYGALDKTFGCPFLFRSEVNRIGIINKCKVCTCRKEPTK